MDRFDLQYYYRRSAKPGTLALVKLQGQEIAGLSLLMVERNRVVVEMLSRNALTKAKGVGVQMLNCIEEYICGQLGINKVYLESLNRRKLLQFYRGRGFVHSGPAAKDREWGVLYPMVKEIASVWTESFPDLFLRK